MRGLRHHDIASAHCPHCLSTPVSMPIDIQQTCMHTYIYKTNEAKDCKQHLVAKFSVAKESSTLPIVGLTQAMSMAFAVGLEAAPGTSEASSSRVSLQSRNGTCASRLARAWITFPNAVNDLLIDPTSCHTHRKNDNAPHLRHNPVEFHSHTTLCGDKIT